MSLSRQAELEYIVLTPCMILKDRLGHYMEYRHKGEILIQVKDDGGLDNVPASG